MAADAYRWGCSAVGAVRSTGRWLCKASEVSSPQWGGQERREEEEEGLRCGVGVQTIGGVGRGGDRWRGPRNRACR